MIKIVTDSSCDLSEDLIKEFDLTVVPIYSRFGEEVFRERVDLTDDEFYKKMAQSTTLPSTTQPTPNDFLEVYQKLSKEADAIISIHISAKLSGTLNSATQAREILSSKINIELIDSLAVSTALGLIVLAAAKSVKEGGDLQKVLAVTKEAIGNTAPVALLDTLKNLQMGGRIGKAKALIGSILNVKPMVTLKDGEVIPYGQVRSRSKGLDHLYEHVAKYKDIDDLAVTYNTTPEDAQKLADRLAPLYKKGKVRILRLGSTLGVHTGVGTLVVSVRGKTQ